MMHGPLSALLDTLGQALQVERFNLKAEITRNNCKCQSSVRWAKNPQMQLICTTIFIASKIRHWKDICKVHRPCLCHFLISQLGSPRICSISKQLAIAFQTSRSVSTALEAARRAAREVIERYYGMLVKMVAIVWCKTTPQPMRCSETCCCCCQ